MKFTNLHAAAALGEHGATAKRKSDGNLLVARNGSRNDSIAKLTLNVQARASVIFTSRSAAEAGQCRCSWLAAELKVQATKAGFAGASGTVQVLVAANVGATNGATKYNVLFIHSVVSGHLESRVIYMTVKIPLGVCVCGDDVIKGVRRRES